MNFDLFPTAHNLAGAALPQDRIIDGKDILPVFKGETPSPHSALFYYDTRNVVAIRHQQRKYVRRHLTDIAAYWPLKQGPFLFDLNKDPNESYSLIESEPEMASNLAAMLDGFEAGMKVNLRGRL